MNLSNTQLECLRYILANPGPAPFTAGAGTLASLRKLGLVERSVQNKGVRGKQRTVYSVTDEGRKRAAGDP